MDKKPYVLDLSDLIPEDINTLNTRTWGIVLRNRSRIDDLEREHDELEILIPVQVTAISTTFVEELLESIIVKHRNVEVVLQKISLKSAGKYNFGIYLENAVKKIYNKEFA